MRSRIWLLALLVAACTRTTLKASAVDEHGSRDEFVEMDFWDGIAEQRAVTNHDAIHALLLTFAAKDYRDSESGFEARLAAAKERGWIKPDRQPAANETARIGWIARAVCIEGNIKGGLTMRIFGKGERYAVQELNYRGWLPSMTPNQTVSGQRLMTLLNEVEDLAEEDPKRPRTSLSKAEKQG